MKKIYQTIKAFSAMLLLGTASMQAQSYCSNAALYTADEEIYNFMLNGAQTNTLYSFTNGCSTPAPGPGSALSLYSNFKSLGVFTNLVVGSTVSFSVAENECDGATYYANGIGIWIDFNQNGLWTDPGETIFTSGSTVTSPQNIAGTFSVPSTAIAGTTVVRVICAEGYSGTGLTPCMSTVYYGEVEDYVVNIVPAVPCSGAPSSNTAVVTPTSPLCSGSSAQINLANTYTVGGITYQWQSSTTSSVGPWTAVSNATSYALNTPTLSSPIWYQCVVTCTNGNASINTIPGSVSIAPTTTNTVPYYEGFEGIATNNQLPNCSWNANNLGSTSRTYISSSNQNRVPRTGQKFASFNYSPGTTGFFWTNGIRLEAGVTYSASVWYTTEYYGYTTWTDMSILYGTSQSTTGLTAIASTSGAAVSPVYKSLSNTFTVATSGLYYIAIRGTSNGSCCGYNLSWDDLAIEIPCSMNTLSVAINSPTTSICAGNAIALTATGADTYSWNTGATTASITATPNSNLVYYVSGTSSLTGCSTTASINVNVNPSPVVSIFADKVNVCKGKSATLFAYGATSYNWSTLSNSTQIVVSPTTTTSYTVIGTNNFGCTGQAVQQVSVLPQPNVVAAGTSTSMCVGETVTLQASGAVSYSWLSPSIFVQSAQAVVSPNTTTTFTLTGTDASGCTNTANLTLNVNICAGISTVANAAGDIKVFPNPNKGEFTIDFNNTLDKTIEVVDFTGKLVQSSKSSNAKVTVNINTYANGVYYVKVISNNGVEVIKVVKD